MPHRIKVGNIEDTREHSVNGRLEIGDEYGSAVEITESDHGFHIVFIKELSFIIESPDIESIIVDSEIKDANCTDEEKNKCVP